MRFSRRVNARSMPSATPWFTRMAGRLCRLCRGSSAIPVTEKPFAPTGHAVHARPGQAEAGECLCARARRARPSRSVPGGNFIFYTDGATVAEVVRRALETCGALAGVPCMVVAVDDLFVVPVPTIMKATGMFRAGEIPSIASDARDDVARQLAEASTGWNAVAVGSSGRPGMAVKAASEQDAVNGALANCTKRDSNCHIIAIGPYTSDRIRRLSSTRSDRHLRSLRLLGCGLRYVRRPRALANFANCRATAR